MPKKCEFIADKRNVSQINENKLSIGSPVNKQKLNLGQFLVRGKKQNTVESGKTNGTPTTVNANLREKEGIKKMDGIEVLREIGRGTYGTVWLVRKRSDQKYLVLKSVDLSHSNQQEAEAARQEVHLLASLKHPNIVSYKGSFELNYQLHLLMGYCEGGDLFTCIKQQHGKLFSEQRVIRWFIQITMALQYLHGHNILHRDLKTQNIFLTRSGLIKLGDFGIARILGSSIDMATTMIGTPYYMSPELFAGLPYNYKSDIWALGCCLYELVTLKHAFHARDMSGLIYKISHGKIGGISKVYSEDLQCLISDMLNRTSDLRPSTSQILHRPFVKGHISAFLKDTKQPAQSGEIQKVTKEDCNLQINPKKDNEDKMKEEVIRPNPGARRCCEIFPELESLQISGDKMKLESRSKVESKPSGVKECQCKRQGNKEMPSAGQGSKSRRRRHHNKNSVIPDSSTNQDPLVVSGDCFFLRDIPSSVATDECSPSTSSAFSARERRRQRRLQEIDLEIDCEEIKTNSSRSTESIFDCEYVTEKEVKAKARIDCCIKGDAVSEVCLDNPLIQDVPVSLKFQEVNDFVNILDTTLSDDGVENLGETCAQDTQILMPKDGLESRIGILEDALISKVGKDQAAAVISLAKTNSWEGWEDQRALAEKILGDHLFSSVATIVWHLKLCYCFHLDELDHPV
ncbi:serine/threonine-protein kinase Nek4-like [Penaeus indicus]|uniref:serine/threonine-protein kinase Nek4-like n=1 Tax=Penaeus indicus TaxID=29960 RepID=UPI00300C432A